MIDICRMDMLAFGRTAGRMSHGYSGRLGRRSRRRHSFLRSDPLPGHGTIFEKCST